MSTYFDEKTVVVKCDGIGCNEKIEQKAFTGAMALYTAGRWKPWLVQGESPGLVTPVDFCPECWEKIKGERK
jgi:hypothetical protein